MIEAGHHTPATRAAGAALRAHLMDLHRQVLDLARQGRSWDQLRRDVRFTEGVRGWIAFDRTHVLNTPWHASPGVHAPTRAMVTRAARGNGKGLP